MSQSLEVCLAGGGVPDCGEAHSSALTQNTGLQGFCGMHTRLLQLHAGLKAGTLLGGLVGMALAGGSEQLERVLPHLTHWGGAVEETRELLWDWPVLSRHTVLALAAATPPVVLERRQRNEKLNVAKINKVPMQQEDGRAEEIKNREQDREVG